MGARRGQEYLEGLRDGREVWFGGKRVDVAEHPAFAGTRAGLAGYFDWQHRYADECLMADPESGERIGVSHLIPKGAEDLRRRAVALERLARYSAGYLGRTPDYVNVTTAGFAGRLDVFGKNGNTRAVTALTRFQREIALKDLALTHTIVHPVVDKSVDDISGVNGELALKIVDKSARGITVRGARLLATLGPFADELFVYPGQPLPKNADPAYALAFSVPMSTRGVVTICRDHYGMSGPTVDRPFSSRFDEQDAFIVFDDVVVPWDRVFIDGDTDIYNKIMGSGWTGNVMQQTSIRAAVKLEFAYELASRMVEAQNAGARSDNQQLLGELWCYSALVRAAVKAAEAGAHEYGDGTWFCDDRPFRALRSMVPGWMARANEILKLVGAHNLIATPEAAAFEQPELAPRLEKYLRGARSVTAQDRAKLFRTAWDFVGSALGGRNELYERFYLASVSRTLSLNHLLAQREQDWNAVPEFIERSEA
ncbi:MAG TPA: 4-hydroxyphenylacetate 3-hydroxylase N-terminal domain-containing protein [Polyangiales bacterium]|nr:4-hydroxyphenylacetate 3-hydroxylase N-terminal domain-containing protein [Polyangiales bacterium]